MTSKAVVIGLDGAAWHLLDPLLESGVMPRLARLRERGAAGTMRSTVPTYTPPAWTSATTGVNPGRHGIYGFIEGHAQHQGLNLVHSGKIKSPTIWEMVNAQGARAGIYNLPLTYPPRPLDGWMVSGMMTPGYGEDMRGFASWDRNEDRRLEQKILEWAPGYVLDVSVDYERDWAETKLCDKVAHSVAQRARVLQGMLDLDPPDVVFSVLESPDRLQHVYYRYMDPSDPLYDSPQAAAFRPAITDCFAAMDEIVGLLDDFAGSDGAVIVCSDHGFTAWEVSVHTNVLLERWGYLKVKRAATFMRTELARRAVPIAKRVLPNKLAREAKGRTFAAIDWSKTLAFASPIPQQGVYLNLKGREEHGIVAPEEAEALKAEIAERFRELEDEAGRPLAHEVHLAQDVFHGEALEGAPDVLPVLRDHRYELDDEVFHRDPFTDTRSMPRGVHHPNGMFIVAGPGVRAGAADPSSVMDVTPTLLYMAGLEVPEGLDGRILTNLFSSDHLDRNPPRYGSPPKTTTRDETSPYSRKEEAAIEESLRGLGYL